MDYKSKYIEEIGAQIEFTSFTAGEVTEFHAILHVKPQGEVFSGQLARIQQAESRMMEMPELEGAQTVFKRYFLSDATNQVPLIE